LTLVAQQFLFDDIKQVRIRFHNQNTKTLSRPIAKFFIKNVNRGVYVRIEDLTECGAVMMLVLDVVVAAILRADNQKTLLPWTFALGVCERNDVADKLCFCINRPEINSSLKLKATVLFLITFDPQSDAFLEFSLNGCWHLNSINEATVGFGVHQ